MISRNTLFHILVLLGEHIKVEGLRCAECLVSFTMSRSKQGESLSMSFDNNEAGIWCAFHFSTHTNNYMVRVLRGEWNYIERRSIYEEVRVNYFETMADAIQCIDGWMNETK